jgi:hypothetical protein
MRGRRRARWQPCGVKALRATDDGGYELDTDRGTVQTRKVVIATGGLSIPAIGATDFGFRVAKQFGLRTVEPRPGLVPLTFDGAGWAPYAGLAGLALPVLIETGDKKNKTVFAEDLLFTHRGLSGPAVLQISSYWKPGTPIRINLAPEVDLPAALADAKQRSRKLLVNELASGCPAAWPRPGWRRTPTGSARWPSAATRPWPGWPSAWRAGNWCPPAPRATKRPKSRWAAWTRATCHSRPWNRSSPACISSARWWT